MNDTQKLPIAVLISGGGTTLKNLIDQVVDGQLDVDIRLVVSSKPSAGGLKHAASANIPTKVIRRPDCETPEDFRDQIFGVCRDAGVELVVMGGFLKHVLIPDDFTDRVINIHPSLIPKFCGAGFYGSRVHAAVLEAGAEESGCTVHYVDDEFDHGPILLQKSVPVLNDDTVESLAARVFAAECEALPAAIRQIVADRAALSGDA